jgi:formylglycine-generating enzyme required for sulfatase activity
LKKYFVLIMIVLVEVGIYAQNSHILYDIFTYQDYAYISGGAKPDTANPNWDEWDLTAVNQTVRNAVGIQKVRATGTAGFVQISTIAGEIEEHPNMEADILEMRSSLSTILEREKKNHSQIRGIVLSILEKHLTVVFILDRYGNITSQGATFWDDAMNADEIRATNEAIGKLKFTQSSGNWNPDNPPAGFVYVRGGSFIMGSPGTEQERRDGEVQHQVTLSGFYMGRHEVTQKEWFDVMGTTVKQLSNKRGWYFEPSLREEGDNYPVYNVSWYDSLEYCNRRSIKEGLTPVYTINKQQVDPDNKSIPDGYHGPDPKWLVTWNKTADGYRLPTEAEWEYACRAGTITTYSTGNTITMNQANFNGIDQTGMSLEQMLSIKHLKMVESYQPNPWGIFDMHGNLSEWCWDWFGDYLTTAQNNPAGAASGTDRVTRGGGLEHSTIAQRSALRSYSGAGGVSYTIGFRVVKN